MAQAAPGGRDRGSGEGCGRWGDIISMLMHADGPKLAKNAVFANISASSSCLHTSAVAASARARVPRRASISSDHEAGLEPLVRLAKPHVEYASSPRAATRSVRQRAQAHHRKLVIGRFQIFIYLHIRSTVYSDHLGRRRTTPCRGVPI